MTTSTDPKIWPDVAIPPGETLEEELETRGLAPREFAAVLGLSPRSLRDLLAGRRAITAELALALETNLAIDAQFWMNLQTDFDLTVARIHRRTS